MAAQPRKIHLICSLCTIPNYLRRRQTRKLEPVMDRKLQGSVATGTTMDSSCERIQEYILSDSEASAHPKLSDTFSCIWLPGSFATIVTSPSSLSSAASNGRPEEDVTVAANASGWPKLEVGFIGIRLKAAPRLDCSVERRVSRAGKGGVAAALGNVIAVTRQEDW